MIIRSTDIRSALRSRQRGFIMNPFAFGGGGGGGTDPDFANVVLLLHGDGANNGTTFTDSSAYARSVTVGSGSVTSTTQTKFGSASLSFPTSSNYATCADAAELRMGTSDFTIEAWFYPSGGSYPAFYAKGFNSSDGLQFFVGNSNCAFRANGTTDLNAVGISNSAWSHVAFCRQGTTRRIYINGSQAASDTLSFDNSSTSTLELGAIPTSASGFRYTGYIDDLRVTKGVCRYPNGTTFTPPTAAFPNS